MRFFRWCVLYGLILMFPSMAEGQARGVISGRVVNQETGQPLVNALVSVDGTTLNAVTTEQGRYVIANVPAGEREIRVSMLGYAGSPQRVQVSAGATATADFQMRVTALQLDGIVVSATGAEQRQREIGNSVAKISTDAVALTPVNSLTNLLQGRASSVVIQPTSGTLGTGSRIRIRGNSSVSLSSTPLLVIDGIRVDNDVESTGLFTGGISTTRWDDISLEEIESIEVLKGPAASALYGTAAASGVIQITTKRGRGGRTEVRMYGETTTQSVADSRIPANYRARGFRTDLGAIGDCSAVERSLGTCTQVDSLYKYNPLLQAPGSPWREGRVERIGGSISGGSEDALVTYFISGESQDGHGMLKSNELNRKSLRANFSGTLNQRLRIGASTSFVHSYIELPQEGNTGSGAFLNALVNGADPSPANVQRGQGFRNPYTAANVGWWRNEENLRRFVGSVSMDWRPNDWLHVNAVSGIDQANRFELSTIPVPGLATGFYAEGLREQYRTQAREFTANLNANMTRGLSSSLFSTTSVGLQYNTSQSDWTYAAGAGLAPGTMTTGEALSVDESFGETKLFGVYGSQQFALNDRLFLTATLRGDQNSAFGENIGFVTYPGVSASWVVREEPWFPEIGLLSGLRLRSAFGTSGQRPGRLSAVRTYTTQAVTIDGAIGSGFIVSNAGNPDLTAELSREIEFGGDISLLDERVAIELTHYRKRTTDALVARPLPPSVGGPTSQFFNLGEVHNRGWDATLRVEALRSRNVEARLAVNFSTNRNRLVSIGDTTIPPITVGNQRHIEGYPLGGYWSRKYDWADANNDGTIQYTEVTAVPNEDQDDPETGLSYMGQPFPTREIGLTADVTLFRNLRLAGLLDFKGGHQLFNWSSQLRCSSATGAYCEARQVPGASLEDQARIIAVRNPAVASSAGYVEDADFWRLREVSITWTLPGEWVGRTRFARSLSLSAAARNLALWTDYTGLDPETNIPGSVSASADPGRFFTRDLFATPHPRSVVFRVDVGM